jgi:hypothetical protein
MSKNLKQPGSRPASQVKPQLVCTLHFLSFYPLQYLIFLIAISSYCKEMFSEGISKRQVESKGTQAQVQLEEKTLKLNKKVPLM